MNAAPFMQTTSLLLSGLGRLQIDPEFAFEGLFRTQQLLSLQGTPLQRQEKKNKKKKDI